MCSALDFLSKSIVMKCEDVSTLASLKRKVALALGRQERTRHFVACCMLSEVNVH